MSGWLKSGIDWGRNVLAAGSRKMVWVPLEKGDPIVIHFSAGEWAVAEFIAKRRNDGHGGKQTKDTRASGMSPLEANIIGVVGELAVAKYLGDPWQRLDMELGLDGGIDLTLYGGITVDVKATTYDPPWLKVNQYSTKADWYALVYVEKVHKRATLIGCCDRNFLKTRHSLRRMGGGMKMILEGSRLGHIETLWHLEQKASRRQDMIDRVRNGW